MAESGDAPRADGRRLKPLLFVSNHAGDASVLADYLRSYGYLLVGSMVAEGYAETEQDGGPLLSVVWEPHPGGVTVAWKEKGRVWEHREEILPASFAETDENRRRRMLRLTFHRLLAREPECRDAIQSPPQPWGILTGVRPSKMLQRFIDQGFSDDEIRSIAEKDFGVDPGRSALLLSVCHTQRPHLPALDEGRNRVSLYIGYPFCPSRCSYCSFPGYELKRWRKWQDACHQAMENEIRQVGKAAAEMGFQVETLYFGGGTPTCMPPADMDRLLCAVQESFSIMPQAEWTVEGGRPETLTDEMLSVVASHPVNRICVNPQSMNPETLARIGRQHDAATLREAMARVRDKGWRINCDLILGLPGEGLAEIEYSLREVLALRPDNVTLHGLAIKRGSAYKEQEEGLPERLSGLEMIARSRAALAEAGYIPYYLYRQKDSLAGGENIGYSVPGHECLYNILMIEERQTILGLGTGAGSKFLKPGDWSLENLYNPKDMIQYIDRIEDLIHRKVDKLANLV